MGDSTSEESFLFSLKRAPEAEKDLDLQIQAIDARIDKLVRGIEINGVNVLGHILNLTHDPEDLTKLGEALKRVAPLIENHDKLSKKKTVFELATQEPGWLAWAFADFTAEVDSFTEGLNKKQ